MRITNAVKRSSDWKTTAVKVSKGRNEDLVLFGSCQKYSGTYNKNFNPKAIWRWKWQIQEGLVEDVFWICRWGLQQLSSKFFSINCWEIINRVLEANFASTIYTARTASGSFDKQYTLGSSYSQLTKTEAFHCLTAVKSILRYITVQIEKKPFIQLWNIQE